ncbi:MAG: 1,2-phenylacetyl-CoA epoxidase subunit B [Crocinitomix sp.]|jgi:ring-1,2-phenylacetyl-CoA epoxidase subunit PaaB|nr:1,2-phenylacetyl-CoA epoxidase subunit B [Crocinitomix sp.]
MDTGDKVWEVFVQKKGGQPFKHAGSCHGYDKKMAIQNARDLYTRRGEGRALWVVPADAIVSVPFDEEDAYFDPGDDKVYRHATFYKIPDGVNYL